MEARIRKEWQGKSVAVIGLGVSNVPLIRFLHRFGAHISGRDRACRKDLGERIAQLEELDIELILGDAYLKGLEQYDAVFLTPGIPKDLPELTALAGKTELLSEIGLVMRYCRAPIFGITGSSGKTTTTTLVGEMFRQSGFKTFVGGNIGTPLIEQVLEIPPEARVVLELSSFQLEQLGQSPDYALVTNISENHLDIHGTMEAYIAAKQEIYRHQRADACAVFNYDDPLGQIMAAEAPSKVYYFSLENAVNPGAYLEDSNLVYQEGTEKVSFALTRHIKLPGRHNLENLLAAAVVARLGGASWEAITNVCHSFQGVEHRLELVGELDGVRYYNDSIATTPARAIAGLRTFSEPVILLAGGYDKKLSFTEMAQEIHARAKSVIVFGDTAGKIRDAVLSFGPFDVHFADDLAKAVSIGRSLAVSGDIVLLSPGCASYGMYRNFAERGEHFRRLVQMLIEEDKLCMN